MGAFLFYVPALSVVTGVAMILGLALMFALGFQTGRGWRKLSLPMKRFDRNIPLTR
jgi:hypothetical protein